MTKEEALAKIDELQNFIENLDSKVGFKDDEIFLLSTEEYEKYKANIPFISCWWWLRSPGYYGYNAAGVNYDGSVGKYGNDILDDYAAVRPACHYNNGYKLGDRFIMHDFPWIVIDEEKQIAISEVPIAVKRFDKKSCNYETSEIRKFLTQKWRK